MSISLMMILPMPKMILTIKVEVPSAEELNESIKQQLAESMIGEALASEIKEAVEQLTKGMDSPLKKVVREHVLRLLIQTLQGEDYAAKIRAAITKELMEIIGGAEALKG